LIINKWNVKENRVVYNYLISLEYNTFYFRFDLVHENIWISVKNEELIYIKFDD